MVVLVVDQMVVAGPARPGGGAQSHPGPGEHHGLLVVLDLTHGAPGRGGQGGGGGGGSGGPVVEQFDQVNSTLERWWWRSSLSSSAGNGWIWYCCSSLFNRIN